ncbi:MAG: MBL fold metallo-hydrolase [Chloroflexi bacterium]|nr:MBL fold metallo-hydrolase [Chloroflexota bacterium]
MRQIAANVYVHTTSTGVNVGAILTSQGLVYIDAPMMPEEARAWRQNLAELAGAEPLYLINTDYHGGHAVGNPILGGTIVAHEAMWKHLTGMSESYRQKILDKWQKDYPAEFAEIKTLAFSRPELTFLGRMTLYCGDTTLQLIHVGGHTPATTMVYLPELRILFTGDTLVLNRYPYLGDANTKEWLDALTLIRRLDPVTVVPGHGDLCDSKATEPLSAYIRAIRSGVRQFFKSSKSKSETISKLRKQDWVLYPTADKAGLDVLIKTNISRVYDEMKAEARKKQG